MGTSKKLHTKLIKIAAPLNLPIGPQRGLGDMPSIEKFIKEGLEPVHAAYAFIQNLTSFFSEEVSQLPEMKKFTKIVAKAEDEYMPSGPPMSPLTLSFFTTWAFYDLRFDGTDTLGSCLIEANDVVCMSPDQLDALKKLAASRMGIYEHIGFDGRHLRLRELITNDELVCHNGSGYRGQQGELWYVRLLPPPLPELATYHIAFTTPYILIGNGKDEWTQFLRRNMVRFKADDERGSLYHLLKYGLDLNYWNEFVFKAYHHHSAQAIFLTGIPDLRGTLPHA